MRLLRIKDLVRVSLAIAFLFAGKLFFFIGDLMELKRLRQRQYKIERKIEEKREREGEAEIGS